MIKNSKTLIETMSHNKIRNRTFKQTRLICLHLSDVDVKIKLQTNWMIDNDLTYPIQHCLIEACSGEGKKDTKGGSLSLLANGQH